MYGKMKKVNREDGAGYMRRCLAVLLMLISLCAVPFSAQASQKISIYIDKDALLAHEVTAADRNIRPEGMLRVVRHSLWPWDEAGMKWSMFVEIENISDEKIVIDENRLIACKANRSEMASAEYIFACSDNVMDPGEKIVLYAGAYPYPKEKRNHADVAHDIWDIEGMADFAERIRQAEVLCVRLDTRGEESSQNWPAMETEPKIRIDGNVLRFEWANETDKWADFRTIGAIVSDGEGRIVDVICSSHSRGAAAGPGETLIFEKQLPPYVTQEMANGSTFEAFACQMNVK